MCADTKTNISPLVIEWHDGFPKFRITLSIKILCWTRCEIFANYTKINDLYTKMFLVFKCKVIDFWCPDSNKTPRSTSDLNYHWWPEQCTEIPRVPFDDLYNALFSPRSTRHVFYYVSGILFSLRGNLQVIRGVPCRIGSISIPESEKVGTQ